MYRHSALWLLLITLHSITYTDTCDTWLQQADACIKEKNYASAQPLCQKVLAHDPCNIQAHTLLTDIYTQQELFYEALPHFYYLAQHNPKDIQSRFTYATLLLKIGHIDNAIIEFKKLIPLVSNPTTLLYNIGYTLKNAGRLDEALSYYDAIIEKKPNYDAAHLARGFALLNKGDFQNGWTQHERYLKQAHKNADALRALLTHNTLANKHITLTYEGGLGDTLMFVRYAELLKNMGAHVTCAVQKPLLKILSLCPYIDELCTIENKPAHSDAVATLMSLPAVFRSTEETIPTAPYLHADEQLCESWENKLKDNPNIKIALVWQSDVHNDVSRLPIARRGMPLKVWYPLLRAEGISVYSLQRFDGTEQIKHLPPDCTLHTFDNLDTDDGSFMDSAALISHMDLVISVDTAIPHLAGGLGKKIWLLLPYAVDWRWIYGRTDSPWYPTMRIVKQEKPFDWNSVTNTVFNMLQKEFNIVIKK